jgi:hypothetical protein
VPSIDAASSSSTGIARRKGTRMMMVTGSWNAICGMITPARVLTRPRPCSIRYSGRIATVIGNSSPAVNRE